MDKSRRLWVLALMLGIGGCAGEDSGSPAAGTAGAGGTTKAAVNHQPAESAPASSTGTPAASKDDSKKGDAPSLEGPKTDTSREDATPIKLTEAEIAKIKTLPVDEQDLALKQAVCPVSGDHLGNMGAPFKIAAEGRTFYLCCKSCVDEVKANPKAVIAKLDKR